MSLIDNLKNVARSVGTSNFTPAVTNFVYSEPLAIPVGYAAYRAYKDENDPYVPKRDLGPNILKNLLMAYGGQRLFTDAPALKMHVRDLLSGGAEKISSFKFKAFRERLATLLA